MRVFASEYTSCGALSGQSLPTSMLTEGRAMLSALTADLLRLPELLLVTTIDRRVPFESSSRLEVIPISSTESEADQFDRLVRTSDATLVIAPETDGVLAKRVRRVRELGGTAINCTPESIELCGDKLMLANHLADHGLNTIPSEPADLDCIDPWEQFQSACVLKPRDGAGSWLTFLIPRADHSAWRSAVDEFRSVGRSQQALLQPFIAGVSLSVSCLCSQGLIELFPAGKQHLDDGRFSYRGGGIPASISVEQSGAVESLIHAACATIPGLRGYVGFDLILPADNPEVPVITEINPRITTSYIGYRHLCHDNLAERLLSACHRSGLKSPVEPLRWQQREIRFRSDGTIEKCDD